MPDKKKPGAFFSGLSAPAQRALQNQGIGNLVQLSRYSEKEILALHGVGPGSLPKLKKALEDDGRSFAAKEKATPTSAPAKKVGKAKAEPYTAYHKDGSVWAKGQSLNGEPHGYFEWYRKGGVIMRSGYFAKGKQVGEWTTYDKTGKVYKVTKMKE